MSRNGPHTLPLLERAAAAAPFLTLVRREFIRMLRRTRPFVFLLLLVGTAGVIVAANYPPLHATPYVMGSYNEGMVTSLVVALFVAALVLLPAYGAASIQSERARNTYDLLILSLVRPSGIVFAKIISTLGYFCLLVIAVLPFLGVSFFLVGVDWQTVIQSGIVILTAALTCAAAGVLASAHCRSPVGTVILGYFTAAVVIGGYLIMLAFMLMPIASDLNIGSSRWLEPIVIGVILTSPVVALAMVVAQNVPGWGILATVLGQGLVWTITVRIATRRLRKPDEPPQPIELDELPTTIERRSGGLSARLTRESIKDNVNPIRVRELRWGSVMGGDRGLAIVGLIATVLLFAFFITLGFQIPEDSGPRIRPDDARNVILVLVVLWTIAGSSIATGVAATSITMERDTDTLDGLLMSRLTPASILRGKLVAALRFSARPLLVGVLALLILGGQVFTDANTAIFLVTGLVSVTMMVLLCTVIGTWVSVRANSTGMALLGAYGLVALVMLVPIFLHGLAREWTQRLRIADMYEYEMLLLNPLTNYFANLPEYIHDSRSEVYLLVWLLGCILHLVVAGFLYYLTERRFARMVTRDV